MGKNENKARLRVSSTKKNRGNPNSLGNARKTIIQKFATSLLDECLQKAFEISHDDKNLSFVQHEIQQNRKVFNNSDVVVDDIVDTSDTNFVDQPTSRSCNKLQDAIQINGRRIIDFQFFFEQLKLLNVHDPCFGCSINNLDVVKETTEGLISIFHMKCNMCNRVFKLPTSRDKTLNTDSVEGAMSIGTGFSNAEELFSVMNIRYMSDKLYSKCHNKVCDGWEATAITLMTNAAAEEAKYALSIGQVDKDGTPLVTVVADGCWSKRSYRSNYNALSGAAAIVGQHTGKVLFIAVKNKFCSICNKFGNSTVPDHVCYKNYDGSSTGMEAKSISEGFKLSESMYGIRYWKMIADGDSNTYNKILESRPYSTLTVEKLECRNHLLRNYCNKLKSVTTDKHYSIKMRKILGQNIMRLRTAVVSAIAYRKKDKNSNSPKLLKKDIDNSLYHVFGSHTNCEKYFCKRGSEDKNHVPELKCNSQLFHRLNEIVSYISNHSRSLLEDVDSNVVEQFNSIIAKFVGGKRINFSQRRSYEARCKAAVVSFNSKRPHYELHKTMYGRSPGKIVKRMEQRRAVKRSRVQQIRIIKKRNKNKSEKLKHREKYNPPDENYGEDCTKTDLDPNLFEMEKTKFLKNLERTDEERAHLERVTVLQADSGFWLEERRKLLTASSFHSVCTRKKTTSCGPLVKRLLYSSSSLNVASINHGKKFEREALSQLEKQENVAIKECGLFVDKYFQFLGATPDGLVGDDLIVEVKCPSSAYKMSADQAIIEKKIKFWSIKNGQIQINMNDKWYYQIQGQLHITGRKACIFGVWTGHECGMKVEYVLKRNDFWLSKMQEKLCNFYLNCILSELVDPRHTRNLPLREPTYITDAQENQKRKKETDDSLQKRKTARRKLFED